MGIQSTLFDHEIISSRLVSQAQQIHDIFCEEIQEAEDRRKAINSDLMLYDDRPEDIPPKPGFFGLLLALTLLLWIGIVIGIWVLI